MKEIRTEDAVGHILCHDITQIIKDVKKGVLFKKGHIVREEDIPLLLSVGKEHLYVWEKKEGILHENEGAEILYKICAGDSDTMHGSDIKEGKIELTADIDGVLKIRREALLAVNSLGEMMIASRHGDFPVKKGDKLAGTRIIPLVIEKEKMDRAAEVAGTEPIFSILPYKKKKVGIVSAIMTSPKLIIMDEPTSGLDPLIQQAFYDILKEENSRGATVFFSSHVLSEVQKLCDRVAILKEGQLIGIQSIKELRESGYKKVSLSAKEAIPRDFFDLSGIANYAETADKTSVSFMYNGNITAIIDKLHLLHLDDVLLEEPSLEEIFMHYYA